MTAIGQSEILPRATVIRALWCFVVLTALLSAIGSALVIELGVKRFYIAGLMWTPGLAALATCKICRLPVSMLGWSWGKARWHWLAYLLPAAYGLAAYGIIWGLGLGGFLSPKFLEDIGRFLGLSGWTETGTLVFATVMFATIGMTWHMATALGEEIGWRGFLGPQLMRLVPFPLAALLTGLGWSLWHVPIIYYTTYNAGPVDLYLQMFYFAVMTVGLSFILQYLRLKSGSLWPATVLHAAHNVFVISLLQPMTIQYDSTWRYANEFGLVLPLVVAAVGVYFWRRAVREGLSGPLNSQ